DVVLFAAILVLVLTRARGLDDAEGSRSLAARVRPVPERLRVVWWVANLGRMTAGTGLAVALVLPFVVTSASRTYLFATMLLVALVGLSVTVLTGWAGQLSLGQFAFVGLGAVTATALVARGFSFAIAVGFATMAGVVAAVLV